MSNAPTVRGLFLAALRRPVLVRPSDAEPAIVLDKTIPVPADVTLPVVVRMGEEAYEVSAPARGGGHLVGLLPHPHDHRQGDVGGDGDGLIEDDGGLSVAGTHQDGAPQRGEEQASDRGCITHDQSLSVQALGAVAASSVASAPSA